MNKPDVTSLCPLLKNLLEHELSRGNRIVSVDSGWSRVKLAVRLAGPLDIEFIQKSSLNNPDLEVWESRDIKNPRERGVMCKSAKQSISGTLVDLSSDGK